MARLSIIVTLIMFFAVALFAQEESKPKKNSLSEGAWAMQFQIINFINFRSFQGSVISVKKHFSERTAVRLGFGFGTNVSSDEKVERMFPKDTILNDVSIDGHTYNFNVRVQYLYYLLTESDINVYFGVGPQIDYFWKKGESSDFNIIRTAKMNSVGIGFTGVAGVEWFATKSISFHAEYSLSLDYNWSKSNSRDENWKTSDVRESEQTGKSFNMSPTSVRFGLSAYF